MTTKKNSAFNCEPKLQSFDIHENDIDCVNDHICLAFEFHSNNNTFENCPKISISVNKMKFSKYFV